MKEIICSFQSSPSSAGFRRAEASLTSAFPLPPSPPPRGAGALLAASPAALGPQSVETQTGKRVCPSRASREENRGRPPCVRAGTERPRAALSQAPEGGGGRHPLLGGERPTVSTKFIKKPGRSGPRTCPASPAAGPPSVNHAEPGQRAPWERRERRKFPRRSQESANIFNDTKK